MSETRSGGDDVQSLFATSEQEALARFDRRLARHVLRAYRVPAAVIRRLETTYQEAFTLSAVFEWLGIPLLVELIKMPYAVHDVLLRPWASPIFARMDAWVAEHQAAWKHGIIPVGIVSLAYRDPLVVSPSDVPRSELVPRLIAPVDVRWKPGRAGVSAWYVYRWPDVPCLAYRPDIRVLTDLAADEPYATDQGA